MSIGGNIKERIYENTFTIFINDCGCFGVCIRGVLGSEDGVLQDFLQGHGYPDDP